MPEIPQFRPKELIPSLPDAVLDRERRPRVDYGGAINAVGQLADSMKGGNSFQHMREQGAEAFGGASAKALGTFGEGLQDLSKGVLDVTKVLATMEVREQEAVDERQYAEGVGQLTGALSKFEGEHMPANADKPEGWRGGWAKMADDTVAVVNAMPYSERVKQRLAAVIPGWRLESDLHVATQATRAAVSQQRGLYEEQERVAIESGNINEVRRINGVMVSKQLRSQQGANVAVTHATRRSEAKQRADLSVTRPNDVIRWVDKPEEKDRPAVFKEAAPAELARLRKAAEMNRQERQFALLNQVQDLVGDGTIRSLGDFAEWVKVTAQNPETDTTGYAEPKLMPAIRRIINGGHMNMEHFNQARKQFLSFDPNREDAAFRENELLLDAMEYPEHFQNILKGDLQRRKDGAKSAGEQAMKYGREQLSKLHLEERFVRPDGTRIVYKANHFLMDEVTDAAKIKVFGLSEGDASYLSNIDGPARLTEFDRLLKNKSTWVGGDTASKLPLIKDIKAYNALPPATKGLFDHFIENNEWVDPAARTESAQMEAELVEELELWKSGLGGEPTQELVNDWLKKHKSPGRLMKATKIVSPGG